MKAAPASHSLRSFVICGLFLLGAGGGGCASGEPGAAALGQAGSLALSGADAATAEDPAPATDTGSGSGGLPAPLPPFVPTARYPGPCSAHVDGRSGHWLADSACGDDEGFWTFTWDAGGRLATRQWQGARCDHRWEMTWDDAGRRLEWQSPWARQTRTVLADGRVEIRFLPVDGEAPAGTTWETLGPDGEVLVSAVDRDGDGLADGQTTTTWEAGRPVQAEWDDAADGTVDRRHVYIWDDAGRIVRVEDRGPGDALEGWTVHVYDEEGRPLRAEGHTEGQAEFARRTWTWRDDGTLAEVVYEAVSADGSAAAHERFVHDERGRPVEQHIRRGGDALEPFMEWTYDAADLLASARKVTSGSTTTYTYDKYGNLLRDEGPDHVVTFEYDCWAEVATPPPPHGGDGRACLPLMDPRDVWWAGGPISSPPADHSAPQPTLCEWEFILE